VLQSDVYTRNTNSADPAVRAKGDRRAVIAEWAADHAIAIAIVACFAFWTVVGVTVYFVF
jgi:hypothetical protein